MKRWLLGLVAVGYLAFIGAQATHAHGPAADAGCQTCVLGRQAVPEAPKAAPAAAAGGVWSDAAAVAAAPATRRLPREASARAPPVL